MVEGGPRRGSAYLGDRGGEHRRSVDDLRSYLALHVPVVATAATGRQAKVRTVSFGGRSFFQDY